MVIAKGNNRNVHEDLQLDWSTQIVNHYDPQSLTSWVFRNCWLPNYQYRKIGEKYLVTTAAGSWVLLEDCAFSQLSGVALNLDLFRELSDAFVILDANNSTAYFQAYRNWSFPNFRHPMHFILVSTRRCNLSCLYCHVDVVKATASKTENDLDYTTAKAIVNFAFLSKQSTISFEFQGGESLLNTGTINKVISDIRRLEKKKRKRVYISIQTNGTLLTKQLVNFYRNNGVSIGSSMDGSKNAHDSVRITNKGNGSFNVVAKKTKDFDIPILPTVNKSNLHEWKQVVELQLSKGYDVVAFQKVYPINNAKKNWEKVGIEQDEFLQHYDQVFDYLKQQWRSGYYPIERRTYLALTKLYRGKDTDFSDFGSPCGMVHSQLLFNYNGDIFTCDEGRDFAEFKIGNVHTSCYDDIIAGQQTRYLKGLSIPNDTECRTCAYRAYCSSCPVYIRAVNGELKAQFAGSDGCKFTKFIYDKIFSLIISEPELTENMLQYHDLR